MVSGGQSKKSHVLGEGEGARTMESTGAGHQNQRQVQGFPPIFQVHLPSQTLSLFISLSHSQGL